MRLKFNYLLAKLGEFKKREVPGVDELCQRTGLPVLTMVKLCSGSAVKLNKNEFESLISYLFSEMRPVMHENITDQQLLNHLRFELIEFSETVTNEPAICSFKSGGKYTLDDITS